MPERAQNRVFPAIFLRNLRHFESLGAMSMPKRPV
jgi:hypothetical protein